MKLLFNRVDKKIARLLEKIFLNIGKDINIPVKFSRLYGVGEWQTVFISFDEDVNEEKESLHYIKKWDADIVYCANLDTAVSSIEYAKAQSTFYIVCNSTHFPFFYSTLSDKVTARKAGKYNILNQIVVDNELAADFITTDLEKTILILLLSCEELGISTLTMKMAMKKVIKHSVLHNCEQVLELIKYL